MPVNEERSERKDSAKGRTKAKASTRKMILKLTVGAAIGAGVGFGFYKLVGCQTGTCPLTSNPWVSSLYGAFLGALAANLF